MSPTADAFGELIDSVYDRHGRIDGVVHGAGVIEDRLIADKELDSLERVMAAKAGAAHTLAERLRPEGLRFMVLFSSVSGRFGNRGQADYAAASEVLGRLAHELDAAWPARVVAIDWGPWRSAGMVSPLLEQEFERRGVALIELDQGCRMLERGAEPRGEGRVRGRDRGGTGLVGPSRRRPPRRPAGLRAAAAERATATAGVGPAATAAAGSATPIEGSPLANGASGALALHLRPAARSLPGRSPHRRAPGAPVRGRDGADGRGGGGGGREGPSPAFEGSGCGTGSRSPMTSR